MKPYYEQDGISIFHGDCRDVMPALGLFDLVLTDPPYPMLKGNMKSRMDGGVGNRLADQKTVGTPWGGDITPLKQAFEHATGGMMAFCSFHSVATVPAVIGADPIGLITWLKRNSMPPVRNVPFYQTEFIWAFKKGGDLDWRRLKTCYDFPLLQGGCMATERILNRDGTTLHPAQKPVALMTSLLEVGGDSILDPYAGTGTTLVAAKLMGRRAVGIEIEEKFCEVAANRLAQRMLFPAGGAA